NVENNIRFNSDKFIRMQIISKYQLTSIKIEDIYKIDIKNVTDNHKLNEVAAEIESVSGSFDMYKSNELVEFYNKNTSSFDGAYRLKTGEWQAPLDTFEVTDYIFIPKGKEVFIEFDGVDWK